jgi:hypothetical protein
MLRALRHRTAGGRDPAGPLSREHRPGRQARERDGAPVELGHGPQDQPPPDGGNGRIHRTANCRNSIARRSRAGSTGGAVRLAAAPRGASPSSRPARSSTAIPAPARRRSPCSRRTAWT